MTKMEQAGERDGNGGCGILFTVLKAKDYPQT